MTPMGTVVAKTAAMKTVGKNYISEIYLFRYRAYNNESGGDPYGNGGGGGYSQQDYNNGGGYPDNSGYQEERQGSIHAQNDDM